MPERLVYQAPANRYIGQPTPTTPPEMGAVPQLSLPGVGGPQDQYANVQGTTDEFYNTVGQLKSYASDMWKTYGIDVTKPDFSQPGGGQPFRTFQELSAKSVMTATDLKERMKQNQMIDQAALEGKAREVEGSRGAPLGTPIQDRAFALNLDPDITEIATRLRENVYSPTDAANLNRVLYQPKVKELEAAIKTAEDAGDFAEVGRLNMNLSALRKSVPQTHSSYFDADAAKDRDAGKKKNYEAEALKEISNIALGRWSEGQFQEDVDDDGNVILINRTKEGQNYGFEPYESGKNSKTQVKYASRKIDHFEKKANGEVWVYFKPSQEEDAKIEPKPERIDNQNPGGIVSTFFQSNPHLGNYATALGQARDMEWTDASGYVSPTSLPHESSPDTSKLTERSEQVKTATSEAMRGLRQAIDEWTKGDMEKPIELNIGGKKVTIQEGTFTKRYITEDGKEVASNLTNDEVEKYITDNYKKQLSSDVLKAMKSGGSKAPSEAEKKAEGLINKYLPKK